MQVPDLSGHRFGSLLIESRAENTRDGAATWNCLCDCGERRRVAGTALRAGRNKSCGCKSPRFTAERLTTHGASDTCTYSIWLGMKRRCSGKERGRSRKNYYGKGIRVCDRWKSFERFLEDMGERPDGMSIERIDGTRGYEPDNCKWATAREQANNTSRNRFVSHESATLTVAEWARKLGIKPNTLLYRLRRGVPVERAFTSSPLQPGPRRA